MIKIYIQGRKIKGGIFMKKEKWLLKEIEIWEEKQIVNEETANVLRNMYQPKKSISLLIVLFSIVGSLLIGMGIVLVSANNWWYSLPIFVKTVIGFLPLLVSQIVVLYVYKNKMDSIAFRESTAILNMAGVFASIALVGQIFHLPGDFTNYMLVCGILFLPTMLVMDAVSPLIIYYWATINGGVYYSYELGLVIAVIMFALGALFALNKCRVKCGKSTYLSLLTAVSLFVLIFVSALNFDCDLSIVIYAYALLLLSSSPILKGCENVFSLVGKLCSLILTFVLTYQGLWQYNAEFDNISFLVMTILLSLSAVVFFVKNIIAKKYCLFSTATFVLLILRGVWCGFGLTQSPFDMIFMVISNLVLFVLSILCIVDGVRKIDLYNANVGMVTLCTLIVLRFFDSELPLSVRGVVFLVLGAGFLLFNLYLVKTKKKIKEENI